MKFIIFFICVPLVHSGIHKFMTTYTGIRGQTTTGMPEIFAVTTLDDQQIDYYDNYIKKLFPKQNWMMEFTSKEMWKNYTEIRERVQQINKLNIPDLMQKFNQSHGLHTYQRMYGCEWDDQTGDSQGFDQYAYDGEDFISLDLKELRYITAVAQGVPTVQKWNNDTEQLEYLKQYYKDECITWLKEFLKLGKADLEKTIAPEVSLLQKHPSSPVVCHATSFYPSGVTISWLRNGQEHHEDVDLGELLRNDDKTFQRTSTLRITPDEWKKNQYTCVVEHQGKTIRKILTEDEIKSNKLHRFITTYTEIRGQTTSGMPEFSAVTKLDDQQIDYYDSNTKKLIPKQDWMKEFASTEKWRKYTEIRERVQQINKLNIHDVMQEFSQSHGLHTYQRMYGCEWDDQTGDSQGFDQYAYDGEDFVALDVKELRYITPVQQGSSTVRKWNNNRAQLELLKQYFKNDCVYWLKEFLKLSKADLEIRAPEVSLLQKHPSSPLVCHATGFYPSRVTITWLRNGLDHHEDVDLGELLPNEDGTFQKTSTIYVTPEDWEKNQYTCVVEHQVKAIQKILTEDKIKSNNRPTETHMHFCV
ncbi:uncharacterized protein LOC125263208 [Megalobrama amblycephala]|uniref:uncharacterized protein LOC125263208 n=1 Tax=Megalobrama amblycephala TaxID=75352 RepID=UPI0020142ECE|nr:uncharacterized protein LOC125263208 [Megalobrama amblycephala]